LESIQFKKIFTTHQKLTNDPPMGRDPQFEKCWPKGTLVICMNLSLNNKEQRSNIRFVGIDIDYRHRYIRYLL